MDVETSSKFFLPFVGSSGTGLVDDIYILCPQQSDKKCEKEESRGIELKCRYEKASLCNIFRCVNRILRLTITPTGGSRVAE